MFFSQKFSLKLFSSLDNFLRDFFKYLLMAHKLEEVIKFRQHANPLNCVQPKLRQYIIENNSELSQSSLNLMQLFLSPVVLPPVMHRYEEVIVCVHIGNRDRWHLPSVICSAAALLRFGLALSTELSDVLSLRIQLEMISDCFRYKNSAVFKRFDVSL